MKIPVLDIKAETGQQNESEQRGKNTGDQDAMFAQVTAPFELDAVAALRRLRLFQPLQYLFGVTFGLDLLKDVFDLAVRTDDERGSRYTHHLLAVHVLFLDHAVGVADCFVRIGYQRKRQVIFLRELLLVLRRVGRNAKHHGTGLFDLVE